MLSTDASILEPGSEAYERMKDYGTLADKLDIIVCTTGSSRHELAISSTTRAIPTNSSSKIWYVRDMVAVAKRSITGDVDVVTSQDPFETGLAGWFIAHRLRAKLQLQVHTDFLSPYFRRESFKNRIRVVLAKWLLPKADGIRVVSERIKKSLLIVGIPEKNIVVLPILVDAVKIQSAPIIVDLHKKYPQFDFIILTASRLEPEKNIPFAIDAMKDVIVKYPKTGLIIAGDGSLRKELEEQASENNLKDNVIFEGWVEDVASYYKTADLLWSISAYEGYSRGIRLSNIVGTSVVTTDVGLVGEALNPANCEIIRIGDTQSLVDATLKLISDGAFNKAMARRAQQSALSSVMSKGEYLKRYKESWQM